MLAVRRTTLPFADISTRPALQTPSTSASVSSEATAERKRDAPQVPEQRCRRRRRQQLRAATAADDADYPSAGSTTRLDHLPPASAPPLSAHPSALNGAGTLGAARRAAATEFAVTPWWHNDDDACGMGESCFSGSSPFPPEQGALKDALGDQHVPLLPPVMPLAVSTDDSSLGPLKKPPKWKRDTLAAERLIAVHPPSVIARYVASENGEIADEGTQPVTRCNSSYRPLTEYSQTLQLLAEVRCGAQEPQVWNPEESRRTPKILQSLKPTRPETAAAKDFLRTFLIAQGCDDSDDRHFRPSTATAKAHYSNFLTSKLDRRTLCPSTSLVELQNPHRSAHPKLCPSSGDLSINMLSKNPVLPRSRQIQSRERESGFTGACLGPSQSRNSVSIQCIASHTDLRRVSLSHVPQARVATPQKKPAPRASLPSRPPTVQAKGHAHTEPFTSDRSLPAALETVDSCADSLQSPLPVLMHKYMNRRHKSMRHRVTHGVPRKPPPRRVATAPPPTTLTKKKRRNAIASAGGDVSEITEKPVPSTVPSAIPKKQFLAKGSSLPSTRPGTQQSQQQLQQLQQQTRVKQLLRAEDRRNGGELLAKVRKRKDSWQQFQSCVETAKEMGNGKNQMNLLDVAELVNQLWNHCKKGNK